MIDFARRLGLIGVCLLGSSCVSYSGVSRAPDGQLYISGGTSYFVYTSAWIRVCNVDGLRLNCVELSESPSAPRGAAASGGAATPPPPARPAPAQQAPVRPAQ